MTHKTGSDVRPKSKEKSWRRWPVIRVFTGATTITEGPAKTSSSDKTRTNQRRVTELTNHLQTLQGLAEQLEKISNMVTTARKISKIKEEDLPCAGKKKPDVDSLNSFSLKASALVLSDNSVLEKRAESLSKIIGGLKQICSKLKSTQVGIRRSMLQGAEPEDLSGKEKARYELIGNARALDLSGMERRLSDMRDNVGKARAIMSHFSVPGIAEAVRIIDGDPSFAHGSAKQQANMKASSGKTLETAANHMKTASGKIRSAAQTSDVLYETLGVLVTGGQVEMMVATNANGTPEANPLFSTLRSIAGDPFIQQTGEAIQVTGLNNLLRLQIAAVEESVSNARAELSEDSRS